MPSTQQIINTLTRAIDTFTKCANECVGLDLELEEKIEAAVADENHTNRSKLPGIPFRIGALPPDEEESAPSEPQIAKPTLLSSST